MRDYGKFKTNKYGTNIKIRGHILPKEEMKKAGFYENYFEGTEYEQCSKYWFRNPLLKLPKDFKDTEISFNVRIYKDTSEVGIDVLDEDFAQPYDYQHMLSTSEKPPRLAYVVDELVEEQMEILQKAGVLSGHMKGEYI